MWFRTPEKVCSSSYAARDCAAAGPGALAIRAAVASAPRAALLQRREMLLGDRDLAIIPALRRGAIAAALPVVASRRQARVRTGPPARWRCNDPVSRGLRRARPGLSGQG